MKATVHETGERRLIEAAQRDPGRFADVNEANFARVYAYVARRVPGREEVEDVTAEVFQQALAGLDSNGRARTSLHGCLELLRIW